MSTPSSHLTRISSAAAKQHIPIDVTLELTHRCNFRCTHCYIPDHDQPDLLATGRILELLDELADMGTLFLALSGGEVFLRPDWLAVARHARRRAFVLRILTNGSLITPDIADDLAALYAQVDVSLYAADAVVFEAITTVPGSFDRVMAGIDLLGRAGVPVTLKMPLMAANADGVPAMASLAESLGLTLRVYPMLSHSKDGRLDTTALRARDDQLVHFYGSAFSPCPEAPESLTLPSGDNTICAAGSRTATIGPTGVVTACHILPPVAGNVARCGFRSIWEGSPWLQYLRGLRVRDLETCSTCSRLAYCSRCPARALVEEGNLLGPNRTACAVAELMERAHRHEG